MNEDPIVDVRDLSKENQEKILNQLLDRLGYEIRICRKDGAYLYEQSSVTPAHKTFDQEY